jgi:hypothetical protein
LLNIENWKCSSPRCATSVKPSCSNLSQAPLAESDLNHPKPPLTSCHSGQSTNSDNLNLAISGSACRLSLGLARVKRDALLTASGQRHDYFGRSDNGRSTSARPDPLMDLPVEPKAALSLSPSPHFSRSRGNAHEVPRFVGVGPKAFGPTSCFPGSLLR